MCDPGSMDLKEDASEWWPIGVELANKCHVKALEITEERDPVRSDFPETRDEVCALFKHLSKHSEQTQPDSLRRDLVVQLLIVCAEYSELDDPWNSVDLVHLSSSLRSRLCELCSCESVDDLLNRRGKVAGILPQLFKVLQPNLLKETWKSFPAAVRAYTWILRRIKLPEMGSILHLVMPTTLILLDDYAVLNRKLGLENLNHIIENVARAELEWYCQMEVIYKSLEPMLYSKDVALIKPLLECLATLFSKTNNRSNDTDHMAWSRCDDAMSVLLPLIEMEQTVALRHAYMGSLPIMLNAAGLNSVRWSKRLLDVFEEYAMVPADRCNSLTAMLVFTNLTWPRGRNNFDRLMTVTLKSLHDLTDGTEEGPPVPADSDTLDLIAKIIHLLKVIAPEQMSDLSYRINTDDRFSQSLKTFFQ